MSTRLGIGRATAVLALALIWTTACTEEAQDPAAGALTDFASGVDAEFGVEAFALNEPTLTIASPTDKQAFAKGATATPVEMAFTVAFHDLATDKGKIRCYLDGKEVLTTFNVNDASTNTVTDLGTPGLKTITCVLLDASGNKLNNPQAFAKRYVFVTKACQITEDCVDGNACAQASCIGFKCQYSAIETCCTNTLECSVGETCNSPNTIDAKCSACASDLECDDGKTCTTDKCDLSGPKGLCKNTKIAPDSCCSAGDAGVAECNDGKSCTIDSCDLDKQTCKHVKPEGVCCSDAECASEDACLAGSCVDFECRFGPDKSKPDCCSDTFNPTCTDNNQCTIDTCDTLAQTCKHVLNPDTPKCCDPKNGTAECADGNACTYDVCFNYECYNKVIAECCAEDIDCDDGKLCTANKCDKITQLCSYPKSDPECCETVFDCDDSKLCTKDSCNTVLNKCQHVVLDNTCCDVNEQCDDGKNCTIGQCVNHGCVFGPDKSKPGCCDSNTDCSDANACTLDTCDVAVQTCKFVDGGDANCCNANEDCDDNDCSTLNFCDASHQCAFKQDPTKCTANLGCDDSDPCTLDTCDKSGDCGVCQHTQDKTCCIADANCNDGKVCTADVCIDNKCQNAAKSNCCVDDQDAIVTCDDGNSCTIDYCSNNQCRHTVPKNGCCASNSDCDNGDVCGIPTCKNIVNGQGTCDYSIKKAGCLCTDENVKSGIDCNDNNPCTVDACIGGICNNKAIDGCCLDKFDCDDGAPCTADYCVLNGCMHNEYGGTSALCCTKENEASDCAFLTTSCSKGICETQADKSRKCVSEPVEICTVQVSYCQDFATGSSLKGMGWNPGDVKGGAKTNWKLSTKGTLGPDQFAELTWTPTYTDYDTCLQSPILQAAGTKTITLQYDQIVDFNKFGDTSIRLLGSLDGANVDWTQATLIDIITPSSDVPAKTLDVTLPANLVGSNGLRLGFCVAGKTTFDLTRYGVDNICVAKGGKPTMGSCPANQIVKLFGNKNVPVKAKDPDFDAILSFSIVKGPSFVGLSSALYFWFDGSWNSNLTINPTNYADVGTHDVTVKVSDGFLYSLCTFQITVTYDAGFLVWRPSEVPEAAGDAIFNGLKANVGGTVVQHVTDLNLYASLAKFEAVFITLGVFPENHVLKEGEIGALKLYLQGGGKIYLESGDTWAFDTKTSLHPFFNIKPQGDSSVAGVTGPLKGYEIYKDISQSPTKFYSYEYDKDNFDWNNVNDQLLADATVKDTRNVLQNVGAQELFWVQVAHASNSGYKTVGSSVLFGGVTQGLIDAPKTMIARVLNFFNNGFVDCSTDAHCNDSDSCTSEVCSAQKCVYTNTCTCQSSGPLACAASKAFDAGAATATDVVETYSCGGATKYTGTEIAYEFVSDTSRPISLTITNLTGTGAKVFVLKASETGCDPGQCIAVGTTKLDFAAAKDAKYFVVVDAPLDVVPKADIAVSCGIAEICTDGIDNNSNGLVDCDDLASCCGDAACGEICDDKDNDCDGKTDEACDDDGDDFCDGTLTVVGKPAVCPNPGADCNDDNSSVNPGVLEICSNGKDDNCDGQQDEEGAAGCTNFYIDLDKDEWGNGQPKCLCAPSGAYQASKGGDCNDADPKVNPADQPEICGNGLDDDCTGTQNDINAVGCTDFYTDADKDNWGQLPKKCLCFAEGSTTASKSGDCDDADGSKNPGKTELCNGKDDDCDYEVDEGCDDDKDGYCDNDLAYEQVGGVEKVCATADQNQTATLTCQAGSTITSVAFASFGNPSGSCGSLVAGGCNAASSIQKVKDACLGKAGCSVPATVANFGEPCSGVVKQLRIELVCTSNTGKAPDVCPKGAGDTNDNDKDINPEGKEICDGLDNDSNGIVDDGCDDDKDGYCDVDMIVVGAPSSCPKGGGDCADNKAGVNPGAAEDCATPDDDDCSGDTNDLNASGCNPYFYDGDADNYGTKDFKCLCSPVGKYTAPKTADCDDTDPKLNPGNAEICDNADNNCDGKIDEGCDDDGDGWCDASLTVGPLGATVCGSGGGDCADTDAAVNPGKAEICNNNVDDNCDGSQNDPDATGCQVYYSDADADGYGTTSSKCLCVAAGTFTATNDQDCDDNDKKVKPGTVELCDGKDNDCDGKTDNGCDDDLDGYCDIGFAVVGTPAVCSKGVGDCNDDDAAVNPGVLAEVCDGKDDDCDGATDGDCDQDKDGYCDSTKTIVGTPAICVKGTGDCNDYNNDQNPGAPEVCGNGIDDDCDGSENDEDAVNCKDYYFDADDDTYGLNLKKCLCVPASAFKALVNGDCADTVAAVNPGADEVCGDNIDNNCDGSENDENATNCVDFFLDQDGDGYGISGAKKCLCAADGKYSAKNTGDCNDTNKDVSPGKTEACNNIDDDCDGKVDTGCDDDADGYCDAALTTTNFPNVCVKGGGDCDDTKNTVNPGHAEICDDLDNNCSGATDEGCDDDNDDYCDGDLTTVGTPATCKQGGKDCKDDNAAINPGKPELCSTLFDDNCSGSANDENATGCKNFGIDADGDNYTDKNGVNKCLCVAEPPLTGLQNGDCNDKNKLINPAITEICDGVDNNCDGKTDEGCDDDGDGYCDSTIATIGKPPVCLKGGGDCNDGASAINPGANEVCGNATDENCDGDLNGVNATGCNKFYYDSDGDGWAVNLSLCLCSAKDNYKVTDGNKLGDCDDTDKIIYPGAAEVCGDNKDSNCNGTQNDPGAVNCKNFYKDADQDGYGGTTGACLCVAEGEYIAAVGGDCNEADFSINPGEVEICDNKDNNCVDGVDDGCDDDNDDYCDAQVQTIGTPSVCPKGGGDCDDEKVGINPAAVEICDNLDQDCNGQADNGCDGDNDGYCSSLMTIVGTPAICSKGGKDCDDQNSLVNPGKSEICDDFDNNCDGNTDEDCDADSDGYCTNSKSIIGTPSVCLSGPGDCNDNDEKINPGATEECNGIDDNCAGGVDETCNDGDGDGYCIGNVSVSSGCPKGGGDCNDSDPNTNPGASEDCATPADDNCNNISNEENALGCITFYKDLDYDAYGAGTGICLCSQQGEYNATRGGDCDESDSKVHPFAAEVCDGKNNDCDFVPKAGTTGNKGNPIQMETYSHGGGFHFFRKEYWYPQWSGTTIYRYNEAYQPQGSFNGGQNQVMGLHGDLTEDAWYSANWGYNTITRRNGTGTGAVWSRNIGTTAGGVAVDATSVYGFRNGSATIYVLNRSNGGVTKTFNLSPYYGSSLYGGVFVTDGKLWLNHPTDRIYYRYNVADGSYDGTSFSVAASVYNGAWNGKEVCVSANSNQVYCYAPPASNESYAPRIIGVDPKSHGGGFSLFHKEYWYPEWAGGNVHRYALDSSPLGVFASGQSETRQIWGPKEEDAYYAVRFSSSSTNSYVRKLKGKSNTVMWTTPYTTTYLSSVAADAASVYAMRYNSSTLYQYNVTDGKFVKSYALSGDYDGDTNYGGLALVAGKLYRGTVSNRNVYRYDIATGVHDGIKFRAQPNIYGTAYNGNEICYSSTSGMPFCYKVPSATLSLKATIIGVDPKSHGGGFHPFRNEFWYPQWAGSSIYRYGADYKLIDSFTTGTTNIMAIAGDTDSDNYYTVGYSGSSTTDRVRKWSGLTSSMAWDRYITTYMGAVTADSNYVYAMNYSSNTVYRLNKSNGTTVNQYNLNTSPGASYGIAVKDGVLWRASYGANTIWGYNPDTGAHNNIKIPTDTNPYSLAATNDGRLCIANTGTDVPYCYKISDYTTSAATNTTMQTWSYGGGYHAKRKEWWFPYWSGTIIYRYDEAKKPIGSFDAKVAAAPTGPSFPGSKLLTAANMAQLNSWYGNSNQKWTRCYQRSTDGASAAKFHSQCNGLGPTITVVKSTAGKTFGGYAANSWSSNGGYSYTSGGWLFSLTHNTKHPLWRYPQYGQYNHSSYGPTWGGGHDMNINNNMSKGYTYFGWSYKCPYGNSPGSSSCQNYLAGQYSYSIAELEVYSLGSGSSLSNIRQVVGEADSDSWYAVRYDSASSSAFSYVNKYSAMPGSLEWTSQGGVATAGYLTGVGIHKDHIYVNPYNSASVYALKRADGIRDNSKDFVLAPYMGSYAYGGFTIAGDKLYRPANDGYLYRFNVGSGSYDGFRYFVGNTAYSYGSRATEHCMGFGTGTTTKATCFKLPTNEDAFVANRAGAKTGSYGGTYHPYNKEFWFPQHPGGIVERYSPEWKSLGNFDSGLSQTRGLAGETSGAEWYAAQYSSSSSASLVYKMKGMEATKLWTAPYVTTYLSGVAIDDNFVYANRYDSGTLYKFDKASGSPQGSIALTGQVSGSAQFGGLAAIGGKVYRATTDRWVYRYDLASGSWDGTMFTIDTTPYATMTDGTQLCFASSNSAAPLYCMTAPSSNFDYNPRPLGMDTKARGGGFHAFHNEYWYPEWSGSIVYRYASNLNPTGTFNAGITSIAQVWGERQEDTYYVVKYSGSSTDSRVTKLKGKSDTIVWTAPYITTNMGGVAADEDFVYTMPATSQTVYRLSKTSGQVISSFNLSGVWPGGTMYGTLAADNGRIYRSSTANWIDAYDAKTGVHTGTTIKVAITPYSLAFNGKEICLGQSSNGQPVYCYSLYSDVELADEGCDDDGDGYCDSTQTISGDTSKTCPKSKVTCDGNLVGSTCYKAVNTGTTWPQAQQACDDWGGSLVTINNSSENDIAKSLAGATCGGISFWIGATDKDSEGIFKWTETSQTASYTSWAAGQPDSKSGDGGGGGGGSSSPQAWSAVGSGGASKTMGTIPGKSGQRIIIEKIGICGDSDSGSGPNRFNASGAGLNFSWSAGQSNVSSTHTLTPTPSISGSARGFSYKDVSYQGTIGQAVTIVWDYHNDWDGRYCQTTDEFGNNYSDSGSTVRAWVKYRYSSNSNGEDYVSSNAAGEWQDVKNATTQNCYLCQRKMTGAQYGNGDDCNDQDANIGPNVVETCDGKDNNCNGIVDEGCDDDNDGYCDESMAIVGTPATCVAGGGDCDDFNNNVSPGKAESCLTPYDDNCDGSLTAPDAIGCTNRYYDGDADGYGTSSFECACNVSSCQQKAYSESFDETVSGWTYEDCAAGTQTTPTSCAKQLDTKGWQVAKDILYSTPTGALYYGDAASKSFNFGASAGRAVSPIITLPDSADIKMKTSLFMGIDPGTTTDMLYVNVLTDNGATRKLLWDKKTGGLDNFAGSKLMSAADKKQLNTWYGNPNQAWQLCYQKSKDGASSSTFHKLCNGKGPTMVVVKSNYGKVFGGYAHDSWNNNGNYINNSQSWLFSLSNKTKHTLWRYPQYAQYSSSSYGPTWGGGHDFYMNSSMSGGSTYFGWSYNCPYGNGGGNSSCMAYLAGNYSSWSTTDVEVYYKGSGGSSGSSVNKWQDLEIDLAAYKGQKIQFEFYFNTVNNADNAGFGVAIDNLRIINGECSKYSATNAGDCDDTNPLKFPSAGAEVCDGVDNNCNGVVDEACDVDGDGYCSSDKPVTNSPACPKTGSGKSANCVVNESSVPTYDGKPITMNHYGGHGATQHKARNEYWHMNWSSSVQMYRWDKDFKYIGSFNSGIYYGRGLASDPVEDTYYGGEYYNYRVSKRSGITANVVWNSQSIGSYIGGVAVDANTVYAMRYDSSTVYKMNRSNGTITTTFGLSGGFTGSTHGGLHVLDGKLYRASDNNWVYKYDANSGAYAGVSFTTASNNYRSFIKDSQTFCTDYSGNSFYCYPLKDVVCTKGDDCNDLNKAVNPTNPEICDGIDNNCDGKIDEGCDDDDDDYCDENLTVVGTPAACPFGGGDCNDTSKVENPGSTEVCDGKDNNCDKVVDEANAAGCSKWYYDGDQDGYGVAANQRCLCKSEGLYTTTKDKDCDDTCANCHPGGTEICDDKNNDCDGGNKVDEGCDNDDDDWCNAAMVTVGKPAVCPKGGNDCQDLDKTVSPGAIETCNNLDDNCNGLTDENASDVCTTSIPNSQAACVAGACKIIGCDEGFYDLNATTSDGCECNGNDQFEPNNACKDATTVTSDLSDKSGGTVELFGGRIVANDDTDWFKFYGKDTGDGGSTACDNFRLRVRFLKNPGNYYKFDIYRGACPADNNSAGKWKIESHRNDDKGRNNQVCCAQDDFNWFTNYKSFTKHTYSSRDSEYGQCGCTTTTNRFSTQYGYNYGPGNNPGGASGGPYGRLNASSGVYHTTSSTAYGYDYTWCHDDSDWYYIKVHKVAGPSYCGDYLLEVSNGVYTPGIVNGASWSGGTPYGN